MHANKREEIEEIYAGDICACVGLKSVNTGDTLCDEQKQIILESIDFPAPVISVAIEPKTKADQDKLGVAMQRLAQEDPTFRVSTEPDTGQTLISGMGELHLEIIVDRMLREYNVQANVGRPQVAYRETIRKKAIAEGKYIKQTGGKGQYGHCKIELHPIPSSSHENMKEMSTDDLDALAKEVVGGGSAGQMEIRQGTPLPVHRQDRRRIDSARIYRADRGGYPRSAGHRHSGWVSHGGRRRGAG